MGILREPKMATKKAPESAKANCDSCDTDSDHSKMEIANVEGQQVVRCVDPVACRMRAQKAGTWCLV